MHISADDHVVAFSIPRDDYVAVSGIKGYSHIKIKEAYGLTKAQTEQKLVDEGIGDRAELERAGREAGRKATIRAVRNLTGQPIDYFAEVNLASFYHLADSLGGVDVCLNHRRPRRLLRGQLPGRPSDARMPNRPWRSCGSGTAWKTGTSTAPIASRPSCCRSCTSYRSPARSPTWTSSSG